jgi:hypothetical protein
MHRGRYRRASSEEVASILSAMDDKLSVQGILKRTRVSTTILYKIIADYPLWSYYLKKDKPNA